jgi:hypothetical protein
MKNTLILFLCLAGFAFAQAKGSLHSAMYVSIPAEDTIIHVPLGGNTWVNPKTKDEKCLSAAGIVQWADTQITFDTYIRVNKAGTLTLKINAKSAGKSRLRVTIQNQKKEVQLQGNNFSLYDAGEWILKDTGYIRINIAGIEKSGQYFADINEYAVYGTAVNTSTAFTKNNEGNFFYWGRRGPSVHLNYPFADSMQARYFYNEVTVPEHEDVVGSYFMANGFGEGYFGIQVNSTTERRILFSVWSPFSTDDPKSIPDSMRIVMLKKGESVHVGEFGNEGSGGQSYMRFNWKAGTTYKFLLKGEPDNNGSTTYTAWFFAPEKKKWMLIASFKRPQTNTYLKRFHSFLENFIPEQGDITRTVLFGNQWIYTTKNEWLPLRKAVFTYDNTAAKKYRMDYAGGVEQGKFFLQNCGFFKNYTNYKTVFERTGNKEHAPAIDFSKLP